MTIAEILKRLRIVIDDAAVDGDSFTAETDTSLTEFIRLALELLSVRDGVEATPAKQTDSASITFVQRPDKLYYAEIKAPTNFVRFLSVKLEKWPSPVFSLLSVQSPLYQTQYCYAAGVGNGPTAPIAFISDDSEKKILAHAIKESTCSYELRYIPTLQIGSSGDIPLAEKYAGALTYCAAALYHESVNEDALAKTEMSIGQAMIRSEQENNENES